MKIFLIACEFILVRNLSVSNKNLWKYSKVDIFLFLECHLCDRRFNQSNNLNKHLKTHGQEKEISKAMETEMQKMMDTVIMQNQWMCLNVIL